MSQGVPQPTNPPVSSTSGHHSGPQRQPRHHPKAPPAEELAEAYQTLGTISAVGKHYRISVATACRWLTNAGINTTRLGRQRPNAATGDSNGSIANVLRNLRLASGLTMAQAAERLNVSQASLSSWERGLRAMSIRDAERILAFYGMKLTVAPIDVEQI